jgi:hypothetical protein
MPVATVLLSQDERGDRTGMVGHSSIGAESAMTAELGAILRAATHRG